MEETVHKTLPFTFKAKFSTVNSIKKFPILRIVLSFAVVTILANLMYSLLLPTGSVACANSISCAESLKYKVENNLPGTFNHQKVIPPTINPSIPDFNSNVLGAQTGTGEKHIYVNLTTQTLSAYQGTRLY